jgi:hypothetical protein
MWIVVCCHEHHRLVKCGADKIPSKNCFKSDGQTNETHLTRDTIHTCHQYLRVRITGLITGM